MCKTCFVRERLLSGSSGLGRITGSRCRSSTRAGGRPCIATDLKPSPSASHNTPNFAPRMRAALSSMALNSSAGRSASRRGGSNSSIKSSGNRRGSGHVGLRLRRTTRSVHRPSAPSAKTSVTLWFRKTCVRSATPHSMGSPPGDGVRFDDYVVDRHRFVRCRHSLFQVAQSRAEFAVVARRYEIRIEHLQAELAVRLAELGRTRDELNRLKLPPRARKPPESPAPRNPLHRHGRQQSRCGPTCSRRPPVFGPSKEPRRGRHRGLVSCDVRNWSGQRGDWVGRHQQR
jgi:hypothetical protein